jgi:GTP cyclohydrolase I
MMPRRRRPGVTAQGLKTKLPEPSRFPFRMAVQTMLKSIGEDIEREGLIDTPGRVAEAWREWTEGYTQDPIKVMKSFVDGSENYDEFVFQGMIPIYSHCEHHMAPFFGVAHIGYIPKGKVLGLSKLSRVADIFAHRLQVQERLTCQIADALMAGLDAQGVGVTLRCRHMCIESRGVRKPGSMTYTSALRGCVKDEPDTKSEFMKLVAMADAQTRL